MLWLAAARLALASIIVLCIWSLRTARHARAGGARVSPGLACGGWWIPYANAIVPFVQLRRVARHRGRTTSWVSAWQGLVIATLVLGMGLRRRQHRGTTTIRPATSPTG